MLRLSSAALALATIIFTINPANAIANLFSNPSFEQCIQSTATAKSPFGWIQSGSGSAANPTVYCSTTRARTGNYSAQFTPQSVTNIFTNQTVYEARLMQNVTVASGGQELTLSYWIYLGAVPEGVIMPQLNGSYVFTLQYHDDEDQTIDIIPHYIEGSCTPASRHFYHFQGTFTPVNAGTLSLSFVSYEPIIYIYLDDVSLSTALVVGDPQFVGLRGQSYQVHGIDGEVYNLVTSEETQVNSKFVFLRSGSCPVLNGTRDVNCWTHPGSYLGSIGVQQIVNGTKHQLEIVSGSATTGFGSVQLNGRSMVVGDSFDDSNIFLVNLVSTHRIHVQTAQFSFIFDNSDMFINQQVTTRVFISSLTSHGLFGQTHQRKTYNTRIKHIQGVVDDYRVDNRDIFGKEFTYNQFQY